MNFSDLNSFTSQMPALSFNVGPETGARARTFTATVTQWLPVNMTGISTYLM